MRRRLPSWRRLILEYTAMLLVYFGVFMLSGNILIALVAMVATMFLLRFTRPKPDEEPPKPPP